MPRPRTPAVAYDQLVALLGPPMRERAHFVHHEAQGLRPPEKIHRGWSWFCGCAAFVRDVRGAYLYVSCVGHSADRSQRVRARY